MPDHTHTETTPAQVATPAALVTPRSTTCGADCRKSPCTLRDMRTAQRALTAHPQLVLWAELATAAHLTGWGAPIPATELLDTLKTMPVRLRDCTISHAVDAAVASRSTVIPASPAALANHLREVMLGRLDGKGICAGEKTGYFAPVYRWCLVMEELQTAHQDNPEAGRHPRSANWEATYRKLIPGSTLAEQLHQVQSWWERDQRDQSTRQTVLWGTGRPSAIEAAVGARREDQTWALELREAAAGLSNVDGLLSSYLTTAQPDSTAEAPAP